VLIVESAGHGLSSQARGEHTVEVHFTALTAALDAVLDEPALLVGNSLGGATALRYAADRPGRVRGLFLTSPAGARYRDAELAAVRDAFRFGSVADARVFLHRVVHRPPPLAGALARVVYARSRSRGIADIVRDAGADHALAPDELARIDVPIRLVWGRSERLLPATALAYWKASLPAHATVVEPDGFGHCPHLDAPLRLARLIAGFGRAVG
jgi:pimeloyl-ACP methyl ester carboxylesterase